MARHFTSALAVIGAVADHREDILRDFYSFRRDGLVSTTIGGAGDVILHSNDTEPLDRIERQLNSEGIIRFSTDKPRTSDVIRSMWSAGAPKSLPDTGHYLAVPLQQPQGHLVKALFDPDSDFEPEFVKEQLRRRAQATGAEKYPEADPAEFYDYTGWNIAYSADVDAWLTKGANPQAAIILHQMSGQATRKATFAYVAQPGEASDLVVADLMAQGCHIELLTRPIARANENAFSPGSYIIYCDRNEDNLFDWINKSEKARKAEGIFQPLETSYPVSGRQGAGSESVRPIAKTEIGVMFGDESSPTSFSGIWFALEKTFHLPFTALGRDALSGDLSKYSCLIFPRGQYQSSDKLKEWVSSGGCAIVLGAQNWAISSFAHLDASKSDDEPSGDLPGSLFRAELDPRNFLCYGYSAHDSSSKIEIAAPMEGNSFFKAKAEGGGAAVFSSDPGTKKLLSGWEWPNDTEKAMQGCVFVHDQQVGQGHVVIFMTDPTDRAMWPGLYKMLLNAIVMGPGR